MYEHIEQLALAPTPKSIESSEDPWSVFDGPFRSRVWESWVDGRRQRRGRVIENPQDHSAWMEEASEAGFRESGWGYQEQLSPQPEHNVSVCGWHSHNHQQSIVTRRVSVANGLGWLVERIPDPGPLVEQAHGILASLDYEGPFELEFVKSLYDEVYKVIELNPRFWMQHRIFEMATKHALVRRCLGLPSRTSITDGPKYWMNTDVAMTRPLISARYLRKGVLSHPIKGSVPALIRRQLRQRMG